MISPKVPALSVVAAVVSVAAGLIRLGYGFQFRFKAPRFLASALVTVTICSYRPIDIML